MSTMLVLWCILTSGSVSFAGSARAVVAEHAFTRTKEYAGLYRHERVWLEILPVLFQLSLWCTTLLKVERED